MNGKGMNAGRQDGQDQQDEVWSGRIFGEKDGAVGLASC
jgi:hypothetical protein